MAIAADRVRRQDSSTEIAELEPTVVERRVPKIDLDQRASSKVQVIKSKRQQSAPSNASPTTDLKYPASVSLRRASTSGVWRSLDQSAPSIRAVSSRDDRRRPLTSNSRSEV
jgi:hypothetical protein